MKVSQVVCLSAVLVGLVLSAQVDATASMCGAGGDMLQNAQVKELKPAAAGQPFELELDGQLNGNIVDGKVRVQVQYMGVDLVTCTSAE